MKKNISFTIFATLLSCVPATAGQPSLCQSGMATRQLCSNLDGIITGEMVNISVLDKLNKKEIDTDKAINLILGAQKYIQSNYIDTIYSMLSDNLEEGDRKFARELQPRIVNVYRKCDLWVNQFQALKPESVSDTDYDNMKNHCHQAPNKLYDAYCNPMEEGKCADKGEKAGVAAFNEFKRKTGDTFCNKLQEIDPSTQRKKIENPVCDCDDAFNNAIDAYIDKKLQQSKEVCKKEMPQIKTQSEENKKNISENKTSVISKAEFSAWSLEVNSINLFIGGSTNSKLTKTDARTGQWLGQQSFEAFYGMMYIPERNVLFVAGVLEGSHSPVLVKIHSTGGVGQNMFALKSDGSSVEGYNYRIGSQAMAVKTMNYENGTLFINNGKGVVYKIVDVGGAGYNMFALVNENACESLPNYNYFLGCNYEK